MEEMGFIDKLVALIDDFDLSAILPQLDSVVDWASGVCRLCVLAAPLIMLALGLWYLLKPPAEANHSVGYRFYYGMGSVEAWRFTQRIAGLAWTALGGLLTIVMFIISLFFSKDATAMVETTVSCVIWELVLIGLCCIAINVWVSLHYDKNGNLKKELPNLPTFPSRTKRPPRRK